MTERVDVSSLRSAVGSLENALAVVGNVPWFAAQSVPVQNTLVAGVIQNFEFVYELSFKMLRRQIEAESASPREVDESNFRDVLRVAAEKGLIADVEAWFKYRKLRNTTAHAYDHEKANQVYESALVFINDARALLRQLEARNA